MSLSNSQRLALVSLVVAAAVFLGALARFNGYDPVPARESGSYASARLDCIGKADFDTCADRVERQFSSGVYEPWYAQHPAFAAFLFALATFFVIAGGARLFRE